jgi:SAM-dependent methyltransferase
MIRQPLRKRTCKNCGLAIHVAPPPASELAELFGNHYRLYAHAPGGVFEVDRQRAYARWIFESISSKNPAEVFEIGCGNGSLLLALRNTFPHARLSGIEPSPAAVKFARIAGLQVDCGFIGQDGRVPPRADLIVCVNVLEHCLDPTGFLESMCANLLPSDQAVIVCPDGDVPSSELLVYDHFFSFTEKAFQRVARRAGLRILASNVAPAHLGSFRIHVLERGGKSDVGAGIVDKGLLPARVRYLEFWKALDNELMRRLGEATTVSCFGVGEAALMLRAYAPRTWSRIERFIVDYPPFDSLDGRPVIRLDLANPSSGEAMLLAVRPIDQKRIQQRLQERFPRLVSWDDFISV